MQPADRFTWERGLRSDPGATGARLAVLLTLGTYMDADGTNARPTQKALAEACGLKERAVRSHLSWAVDNGWLEVVQRGHHIVNSGRSVASLYRATAPQPAPPDRLCDTPTTGSPEPVVEDTSGIPVPVVDPPEAPQPARNSPTTGTHVPPTTYQELPTSPLASTHEVPEAAKGDITPKRILTEMARRRLVVLRQQGLPMAPPEGCDPRRVEGFLRTEVEALRAQHGFALDALIARHHPDTPAQPRHADPDWYVWKLDPDLARRDWSLPTAAETRAKLDADRAAWALDTPEKVEANRAGREAAMALRDELREARERRARRVSA